MIAGQLLDLGLRGERGPEADRFERRIEEVAAHVAERAGAEIKHAAPFERGVGVLLVSTRRSDAEPRVPVEMIGDGVVAGGAVLALRPPPGRAVGPEVDRLHLADHAVGHVRGGGAAAGGRLQLDAHLRDDALRLRLLAEFAGFPKRARQGLLAVDVLLSPERAHDDRRVVVVGRRAKDRVEPAEIAGEEFAVVGERLGAGVFLSLRGQGVAVDVAEGRDFEHRVLDEGAEIGAAHAAAADGGEPEFAVGRAERGARPIGLRYGRAGGEGPEDERAAVDGVGRARSRHPAIS